MNYYGILRLVNSIILKKWEPCKELGRNGLVASYLLIHMTKLCGRQRINWVTIFSKNSVKRKLLKHFFRFLFFWVKPNFFEHFFGKVTFLSKFFNNDLLWVTFLSKFTFLSPFLSFFEKNYFFEHFFENYFESFI